MNCKYILLCFFLLFKVSIAQKNIEFKNNLIKSYIQKGNYSKALQYNQSFLEQSKTNIDTLNYNINKAILLVFHGDMIEANKLISKMNSLEYPDIEKYRYYELMIQYSYSEGQMYLAKDFLKKSVDISKNIDEPNIKMKGVLNDIFLRSIDRNSKNKDSIAHHEQWLVEQFNIIEPMFKDVFPENQSIYLKYRLKLHPENKNISKKDKLAKMEVIHGISQKHDLKVGIFQYLEFRFNEEKNHQKKKRISSQIGNSRQSNRLVVS